jgi:hypothetical protein
LTLIVACVALAWSNPAFWQAVVEKASSVSGGIVGVFAATYGVPGWGWLLIALIVAGVVWRWFASGQRAEALAAEIKGRDQQPTIPTVNFYDDFGVQVLYRVNVRPAGNVIEVIGIMCKGCKMHLQQQRMAFTAIWYCIRCDSVYPDVPAEVHDVREHIRGSIIRGEIAPAISTPTGQ